MRCVKVVLIVVFCFFIPMIVIGGQTETQKKANSIDELAKMYDVSSCKVCHPKIYEEWSKSLHARSIYGPETSGRTASTFKTTIINGLMEWPYSGVKKPEDVKVEHLMICAKCHLPQLKDATDKVAQEIVKNIYAFTEGDDKAGENLEKLNINCLICHNRNAIIHKWTDGQPQKDTVYGKKEGTHLAPTHPKLKKGPVQKEAILCGQCHGLGPNFELENPTQCATLYGTYLWSYLAEGGQSTCQECHMHKSKLGHNIQSYRSKEMQKMALDFDVEVLPHWWRDGTKMMPVATVKVNMKNKAGHAIPDG
ncbi:MAG: multiheme c-type cytochrome ExtKL [Thermodesulfovibrionales bacterium]|nr:multiheme c-type cytochrome ExtKL [Thermodesulfovibrionales bacterium]